MSDQSRDERSSRRASGFQLGPGVWTRLRYRAFDADGELIDGAGGELGFVFGYGVLLPALEGKLEGHRVGETVTVDLAPRDAFGERDPARQLEIARDEFPPDLAEGDRFELERDDGSVIVARVLATSDELVVLDMNHPLAGQRVRFEIEVLEARAATPEELALAEDALLNADGDAEEPLERLIPAADLLRRGQN